MTPRQCIGILCLVAFLPSCATWRTYPADDPPTSEHPVRVFTETGRQFADSISVADSSLVLFAAGAESRIPQSSVRYYEAPDHSGAGYAFAALGVGALIALFALAAGAMSGGMTM